MQGLKYSLIPVVMGIYLFNPHALLGAPLLSAVYKTIYISPGQREILQAEQLNPMLIQPDVGSQAVQNHIGYLTLFIFQGGSLTIHTSNATAISGIGGGLTKLVYDSSDIRSQMTAINLPYLTGALMAELGAMIDFSQIDITAISDEAFAAGASVTDGGSMVLKNCTLDMTGPNGCGLTASGSQNQTQIQFSEGYFSVKPPSDGDTTTIYGIKSESGGRVNLKDNRTNLITGYNCYGLSASGTDSVSNPSAITCSSSPLKITASQDGYGVIARQGGKIDFINSDLELSGDMSYGIMAQGASTASSINSLIRATASTTAYGAWAGGGGVINLPGSMIQLVGNSCYGVRATGKGNGGKPSALSYGGSFMTIHAAHTGYGAYADSGGVITVSEANLKINGDSCYGVAATDDAEATCTNCSLVSNNLSNGWGAYAGSGGSVILSEVSIFSEGSNCYGVMATGKASDELHSTITSNSSSIDINSKEVGCAAVAEEGGHIKLKESSLTVATQNTFAQYGLKATKDSLITASDISVSVAGKGLLYGAYASDGGQITLSRAKGSEGIVIQQIQEPSISPSYGLYANTFGIISAHDMNVTVGSDQGVGVQAQGGGTVGIYHGDILLKQPNTTAIHLESGGVTLNAVNIINQQNEALLCKGIVSKEGSNWLMLSDTSFSGDFSPLINVENSYLKMTAEQNCMVGTSGILGNVNGGSLELNASQSQLKGDFEGKGDITVTLSHEALWSGTFKGEEKSFASVHIDPTSRWKVTADASILLLNNEAGVIEMHSSSPVSSSHLIVDQYQGNQGEVILNTSLGFQNSASDLMTIYHYSAAAPTAITLQNQGGVTATVLSQTTPLIKVSRQDTLVIDESAFFLKNFIGGDNYNYAFQYNPDDPNWHIWNLQLESQSSNTSLYANLPATALTYGLSAIDTLYERMGGNCFKQPQEARASSQLWSRLMYENGHLTEKLEGAAVKTIPSHFTHQTVQIGSTICHSVHDNLHQDDFGVFAAIGEAICHIGDQDLLIGGKNKMKVGSLATYLTHYAPFGGYLDAIIQGSYYDARAMNTTFITATKGMGITASLEGGLPFNLGEMFTLEPQIQLISQFIHFSSFLDGNGQVKLSDGKSIVSRAGLRAAKQWMFSQKKLSLWTRLGGAHEFLGDSKATLDPRENSLVFSSEMVKSWANLMVGADLMLTPLCSLYGSSGYSTDLKASSSYTIKAGMKWTW